MEMTTTVIAHIMLTGFHSRNRCIVTQAGTMENGGYSSFYEFPTCTTSCRTVRQDHERTEISSTCAT